MNQQAKSEVRIIPLGGLGEIGLNMMVFEQGDDIIVVDCGLMFPGDSLPGIDYVIPDFSYLVERKDKVRGLLLTHGHEDHIGAIPFFLPQVPTVIYSSPLTLGLVRAKLIEFGQIGDARLETVRAGDIIELGSFSIEFIRVSHSIADCLALAIRTEIGNFIHTGDFKLDPTPIDGLRSDFSALARYGDRGVLTLLSDSTNVERGGYTLSEREVGKAFREVFEESPGRIVIAMFASNIHRIQQVIDAVALFGRKVAFLGRSMVANIGIARELGYLEIPAGVAVDPDQLASLPDREVVLLTTGTQGEPLSGLARMARDEHRQITVRPGDTIVLSSRFIPGNERAIDSLINEFYRRGAEVIYEKVSDIHVSGHASQEELKLMIGLTRPRFFIPVHGEYRHLVKHAQLAVEMGIPRERVLLAEDGDVIYFDEVGGERVGRVDTGRQVVDGACVADYEDMVLQERRRLAKDGVLLATARIDLARGELVGGIVLASSGFLYVEDSRQVLEEAKLKAEEEFAALPAERRQNREPAAQELRQSLKRAIKKRLFRYPVVIVTLLEG